MAFTKNCPLCEQEFLSLDSYMSHIKNNHNKESPDVFVKEPGELKWKLRNDD